MRTIMTTMHPALIDERVTVLASEVARSDW
jgi:hypothetical protein